MQPGIYFVLGKPQRLIQTFQKTHFAGRNALIGQNRSNGGSQCRLTLYFGQLAKALRRRFQFGGIGKQCHRVGAQAQAVQVRNLREGDEVRSDRRDFGIHHQIVGPSRQCRNLGHRPCRQIFRPVGIDCAASFSREDAQFQIFR